MNTVPACELIGHEGEFRLPGGRATYEAVCYDDATARSDRARLCRITPVEDTLTGWMGLRQVNRYVDWDQPVEVIRDCTAEYEAERAAELEASDG